MHVQSFTYEHKELQHESDGTFAALGDEIFWTAIGPLPFEDLIAFRSMSHLLLVCLIGLFTLTAPS